MPQDRNNGQPLQETLHRVSGYVHNLSVNLHARRASAPRSTRSFPQPMRGAAHWCVEQYTSFIAALGFLSVLPLPGGARLLRNAGVQPSFVIGAGYFSLVGLLLAALLSLLALVLDLALPQFALVAILVVVQVALTGGLHLDGLMDSCDGLFGGATPERRLEIMRDSRVGSFGVLAGACLLLLKFAFFASLSMHQLPLALLMTLPVARWGMVLAGRIFPSARPMSLGAAFHHAITLRSLLMAGMIALIVALVAGRLVGLAVWMWMTVGAIAVGALVTRLLGGLTGDAYGAIAEFSEMTGLLLLVFLRAWF
jgi:adenosylcobinamide-GDP ribazoletransferase